MALKPILRQQGHHNAEPKHVHFASDQVSGSHAPPAMFRSKSPVADFLRSIPDMLSSALNPRLMRQEIPFERWYFHATGEHSDLSNPLQGRFWAVMYLGESIARTLIELIANAVAVIGGQFFPHLGEKSAIRRDILKAQAQGLFLNLLAAVSPEAAINAAMGGADKKPIVGCKMLDWKWGTPYAGKFQENHSLGPVTIKV